MQGALAGVAVPSPEPELLSGARASLGGAKGLRGRTFPGGLILWDLGLSIGVSHAELLEGLGLRWLGGQRGIAPPGCRLQPVSVAGHWETAASARTARICWVGIV